MKRHFFIKKTNTIFKGSNLNMGYSPIVELNYGKTVSRILLKPEIDELVNLVKDKDIMDIDKIRHTLHMTNCGSIDIANFHKKLEDKCFEKVRTSSFDIIAFRLPRNFDQGTGSSQVKDVFTETSRSVSTKGSTWFQAKTNDFWAPDKDTDMGIDGLGNGVYTNEYLKDELKKFKEGKESIVVGIQHFDSGSEDLDMDLTKEINECIKSEVYGSEGRLHKNFGIGLAFSPDLETLEEPESQYVGFFSPRTNTKFNPYIETELVSTVDDDRNRFIKNADNDIYLYCEVDGKPVNLDSLPVCKIDEINYEVKQARKGIYSAHIPHESEKWDNYSIQYDTWSNLALNGVPLPDQELSFVVEPSETRISFGGKNDIVDIEPCLFNINDRETLMRGEKIEVGVSATEKYSLGNKRYLRDAFYRIKMKEGNSYRTIFDFSRMDNRDEYSSFMLYTNDFVPGKYYIDLKILNGKTERIYENIGNFIIEDDITNSYN